MEKQHPSPSSRGALAERLAENYLLDQGLQLLARNVRYPRGEIDLLMLDGSTLVFVEVRSRSNRRFPSALASVDSRKQRRLQAAAALIIQRQQLPQYKAVRFDVVAFDFSQRATGAHWVKQAFDVPQH